MKKYYRNESKRKKIKTKIFYTNLHSIDLKCATLSIIKAIKNQLSYKLNDRLKTMDS